MNPLTNKTFSNIYSTKQWGTGKYGGNGSGLGSCIEMTTYTREIIESVVKDYNIKSICDVPCGAMCWMPMIIDKMNIEYTGLDIVDEIIQENKIKFKNYKFSQFDITTGIIGNYDLIICRDALQHLSYPMIFRALENFSNSSSKYILLGSYASKANVPIITGDCFDINLLKEPFSLPEPIKIFHEKTNELGIKLGFPNESEKLLLLYEIKTLKGLITK